MHATDDRLEFAPPPQPGLLRAFGLAVIAHVLLAVALTQGLQWQRETENVVAEAELWSAVPQKAAPREPTPVVAPAAPTPPAPPPPVVRAPPQPDPQVQRDAQIALERERDKREAEERKQARLERERDQKRKLEAQKKREEEVARRKEEQAEKLAEAKRKEEQAQKLADAKRKEEQAQKLAEAKRKEQEARDAKRVAQQREENLRRIQGMAGDGSPDSTGSAARSSGPSGGYAGRIAAIIKRNTRFVETVAGDPPVEVEIRLSPDGTIVGQRLVKSSGNRARDEAVLRGIQAAERLPRDVDGRIHSPMNIRVRQFD